MVLAAAGYLGVSYFNLIIWANIIDVIDDVEVKTGKREDGTVYAVYSFARKVRLWPEVWAAMRWDLSGMSQQLRPRAQRF